MFDPFDRDQEPSAEPRPPYPTPTAALLLTLGASLASLVVALLLFEEIDLLALGVGEAVGVGGVATWAARRVPEPQPERLGLRGFSPRLVPVLLCLIPLVFVTSELDNWGREIDRLLPALEVVEAPTTEPSASEPRPTPGGDAAPADAFDPPNEVTARPTGEVVAAAETTTEPASADRSDEASADPSEPSPAPAIAEAPEGWALIQVAIVTLGISPVVEGFLFFGVILQGLITWLGRRRGLLLTACLYAMIHAFGRTGPDAGLVQALFAIASVIAMGLCLGVARLATGSVLAPILVDTGFKGVALLALAAPDLLAVPGYNVDLDAHTPLSLLIPAAGTVVWGLFVLLRAPRGDS